ncbi:MAG: Beta-galactosidase C-terminal domain, partial [Pseudomonadota bacterium]
VWQEDIATELEAEASFTQGSGAIYQSNNWTYLAFWPDESFLIDHIEAVLTDLEIETVRLNEPLRLRRLADLTFAFNSGFEPVEAPAPKGATFLVGGSEIAAQDVAVWKS